MTQKTLAGWLKTVLAGIALAGALIYAWVIPALGKNLADMENGLFRFCYEPWLLFLLPTALPCAAALVISWRIAGNIGRDRSFISENAKLLKWISALAACDSAYFLIGNIVLMLMNMSHPSVLLSSILVVFIGAVITVLAAALSHLVMKAAKLQDDSDLTI